MGKCFDGRKENERGLFATFNVTIELTENGLSHVDDCVECVFQYIAMLKTKGPQRWIYDEVTKVSAINVKYKSKSRTFSYVTGLAKSLHYYPNSEVLLELKSSSKIRSKTHHGDVESFESEEYVHHFRFQKRDQC